MNSHIRATGSPQSTWFSRLLGLFNLNDSRWGRGDEKSPQSNKPDSAGGEPEGEKPSSDLGSQNGRRDPQPPNGPPDLEELWRDLNRKLSGLFGKPTAPQRGEPGGGGLQPDMRNAGIGIGLIAALFVLIWLCTGFFIVQEGQHAVITQFGKYKTTVTTAGLTWRMPYPIEQHQSVVVTLLQSVDVGRDTVLKATGLRDSSMLTEDENILDIKFAVQYRLSDARAFLFESKNPADAVVQAAETAVREVVGKMKMDAALSEERDQIAPRVRALMQQILDRYNVGVVVEGINLQQGGVRPPDQVQASFDDVLKAGQERERAKNDAQAYANNVIPSAVGSASRLKEEADAYKARVVAQAEGDSQRFRSVFAEYQKAPQVTRDRMYLDAMQQIYTNVTKVLVDSRQGSNLLYLPLEKLLHSGATAPVVADANNPALGGQTVTPPAVPANGSSNQDARSRDSSRTRQRETR
jgi:modulator of FtsH protease HflK